MTMIRWTLAVLALASCASLHPPIENSGPATSREGVAVAVTRQDCSQIVEPERPGNDLTEEILEVQVRNAGAGALTVHPDAFRLVTPDGYALEATTFRAVAPLTVAGGGTRSFELRFMTRGSLQCAREMRLEAGHAVVLQDRPVELGAVRFRPSRSL